MNGYLNLNGVLRSGRKTKVLGLSKNNYFLLNSNLTRNWFIVRPSFF